MSTAAAFKRIFAGLERRHGRYIVPKDAKPNEHGKIEGKAWTASGNLEVDDWVKHLSGEKVKVADGDNFIEGALGLGVVPIRDDATAVFGAIDVDIYPLDLTALQDRVRALQLPLIVCRTKSGGAHLYLFLKTPATAELVRAKLMDWAVALGYPGVEVFPKHTRLASENDSSYWINIPYQGGKRSVRYGLKDDGTGMTPEEFVAAVDAIAITPGELEVRTPPPEAIEDDAFLDGPPCLQTLARTGFGDWQNNSLFNIIVYLRKKYPDDWETHVQPYNMRFLSPPVPERDAQASLKSGAKKKYSYGCKMDPLRGACNRQVCLKREFGVGGANDDPGVVFGELTKVNTDPPLWLWDVDGARLEVDTATLMDQRKFQAVAIEKLTKWPHLVKPVAWQNIIRERLARAEEVDVPEDATREGQFRAMLKRFCSLKSKGKALDEMLKGSAFTDKATARTYFRSTDFFAYLSQHRFSIDEKTAFNWIRKLGVEEHQANLKGEATRYWSVPAFEEQTEPFDVPRVEKKEGM